jgi:hypothetical protein
VATIVPLLLVWLHSCRRINACYLLNGVAALLNLDLIDLSHCKKQKTEEVCGVGTREWAQSPVQSKPSL